MSFSKSCIQIDPEIIESVIGFEISDFPPPENGTRLMTKCAVSQRADQPPASTRLRLDHFDLEARWQNVRMVWLKRKRFWGAITFPGYFLLTKIDVNIFWVRNRCRRTACRCRIRLDEAPSTAKTVRPYRHIDARFLGDDIG